MPSSPPDEYFNWEHDQFRKAKRIGGGGKQIFRMHLAPSLKTFLPLKALKATAMMISCFWMPRQGNYQRRGQQRAREGKRGQRWRFSKQARAKMTERQWDGRQLVLSLEGGNLLWTIISGSHILSPSSFYHQYIPKTEGTKNYQYFELFLGLRKADTGVCFKLE